MNVVVLPLLLAFPVTTTFSVWTTFSLGVLHGLEPGHGKAIVSAYVVGKRPNVLQIMGLCGVLTIAHSVGALGLVLLGLAFGGTLAQLNPVFMKAVHILAASFVLILGIMLLWQQRAVFQSFSGGSVEREDTAVHRHHHHPADEGVLCCTTEPPSVLVNSTQSSVAIYREIWLLGLASGLKPCPLSLFIVTSSLQVGQVAGWLQGLLALFCFSLGMGVVLGAIGFGVRFVTLGLAGQHSAVLQQAWWMSLQRYLPLISAGLIFISGGVFLYWAITNPLSVMVD
jgi:nickel/cobalt exporter